MFIPGLFCICTSSVTVSPGAAVAVKTLIVGVPAAVTIITHEKASTAAKNNAIIFLTSYHPPFNKFEHPDRPNI